MKIKGKNIRSLSKYIPQIENGKVFRVGVPALGNESRLEELGFPSKIKAGRSILPAVVGRFTKFNSQGYDNVRKDLPKITKSRMIHTSWNDWHGNPHSGIQYRDYEVYQKEHINGPEDEISILQSNSGLFAVSEELTLKRNDDSRVLHVINLFLECFGECELFDQGIIPIVKVKKVHWQLLPRGKYPWERMKDHIKSATARLKETERPVIEHRIEQIARHQPDFVAVGTGGFDGYFVFGFSNRGLFVMESSHLDNATYVLKSDWQNISHLTKREILSNQLHHERLIHNKKWRLNLEDSLTQ